MDILGRWARLLVFYAPGDGHAHIAALNLRALKGNAVDGKRLVAHKAAAVHQHAGGVVCDELQQMQRAGIARGAAAAGSSRVQGGGHTRAARE